MITTRNKQAIPGLPNDLVKLIISFLPYYDQMVLRNVAWLFAQYIPHPVFSELKAVMSSLPYGLRLDTLSYNDFYICKNDILTHNMMLKLIPLLTDLHKAYSQHGKPIDCYDTLVKLYKISKINISKRDNVVNRLSECHPFFRSILMDIIYLKISGEITDKRLLSQGLANAEYLLKIFEESIESNASFVNPLLVHRMMICRILLILEQSDDVESNIHTINDKFNIKLHYHDTLLAKLKLTLNDPICYSNIEFFRYVLAQLCDFHAASSIATFTKFLAEAASGYHHSLFITKPIPQTIGLEPSGSVVSLVNQGVLTPSREWYDSTCLNNDDNPSAATRTNYFLSYVNSSPGLKMIVNKPLSKFPIWLRHIFFQPDLIDTQYQEFMMSLDLLSLPKAIFSSSRVKMTTKEIFGLANHFLLASEFHFHLCNEFLKLKHDDETIGIMINHFREFNYSIADINQVIWAKRSDLTEFVHHPIFQELKKYPQLTADFYRWACDNLDCLHYTYRVAPEFFTATLVRLTSPYTHYGVTNTTWLNQLCKLLQITEMSFLIDIFHPHSPILADMMEFHPGDLIVAAALARDASNYKYMLRQRMPSFSPVSYDNLYEWLPQPNNTGFRQSTLDFVIDCFYQEIYIFEQFTGSTEETRCLLWFMGFHYIEEFYKPITLSRLPTQLEIKDSSHTKDYAYERLLTLAIFKESLLERPLEKIFEQIAQHGFDPSINYVRQISADERNSLLLPLISIFFKFNNHAYIAAVLDHLGINKTIKLAQANGIVNGHEWFLYFANATSIEALNVALAKMSTVDDIIFYLASNSDEIRAILRGSVIKSEPEAERLSSSPHATFFRANVLYAEPEQKRYKPATMNDNNT